jgi:hydrogenase maturation protein HypF
MDRAGLPDQAAQLFAAHPVGLIRQAAAAGINSLPSSSAGRLFDAFAASIGICVSAQSFEGEAAMRLEAMARRAPQDEARFPYVFGTDAKGGCLDDVPLWQDWAQDLKSGVAPETMALRFHAGVAASFALQVRHLVEAGEAAAVALTGGCFQNALLLELTLANLRDIPVLLHSKVPANDGGLALGQAVIAAARHL